MNADLAALIPPAVICVAVLIAVGAFLRHEMSARRARRRGLTRPSRIPAPPGSAIRESVALSQAVLAKLPMKGHAETTERGSAPRQ